MLHMTSTEAIIPDLPDNVRALLNDRLDFSLQQAMALLA
jgi:hypothetical protein